MRSEVPAVSCPGRGIPSRPHPPQVQPRTSSSCSLSTVQAEKDEDMSRGERVHAFCTGMLFQPGVQSQAPVQS